MAHSRCRAAVPQVLHLTAGRWAAGRPDGRSCNAASGGDAAAAAPALGAAGWRCGGPHAFQRFIRRQLEGAGGPAAALLAREVLDRAPGRTYDVALRLICRLEILSADAAQLCRRVVILSAVFLLLGALGRPRPPLGLVLLLSHPEC